MSTEATRTGNLHGVLPAVSSGAVKGDRTALFAELAYCGAIFAGMDMREYGGTTVPGCSQARRWAMPFDPIHLRSPRRLGQKIGG